TTGTLASRAKTATVKAATAKAATAKAATAKAATAARSAAVTTVANHTAGVRTARAASRTAAPASKTAPVKSATAKAATAKAATENPAAVKPAAVKPAALKPAPAKATTAKATTAKATTAAKATAGRHAAAEPAAAKAAPAAKAVWPTPHKRATPAAATPVLAPVVDVVVVREDVPVESVVEVAPESNVARLPRFLRRQPPTVHRRPSFYMAAALVGALGLGAVTTGGPAAQATSTMSSSVSVAQELGIGGGPTEAITPADATQRLGELAVSRNVRDDEQAAAALVQAEADRVAAEAAAEAARPKAALPVHGARLTSTFGARWGTLHAGIDLAAPIGTPEYSAMDGVVLEAGPASGYGNAVYIQHENGDVTVYGHMEEILVTAGQVVKAGDTIALLGNRGQSTGPHLHFEVHVGGIDGQKVDPLPWLRERGIGI
ncbi:MAG: M23 family metallopeptidase, partial [Blastococcus sp.]